MSSCAFFQSAQLALDKERSIASNDLDFSRTATLSPGLQVHECLQLHHSNVCSGETSCALCSLEGATPISKKTII
jgi:hypothetical protein